MICRVATKNPHILYKTNSTPVRSFIPTASQRTLPVLTTVVMVSRVNLRLVNEPHDRIGSTPISYHAESTPRMVLTHVSSSSGRYKDMGKTSSMSVQERIRALNKSTRNTQSNTRHSLPNQPAQSPIQVAPVSTSSSQVKTPLVSPCNPNDEAAKNSSRNNEREFVRSSQDAQAQGHYSARMWESSEAVSEDENLDERSDGISSSSPFVEPMLNQHPNLEESHIAAQATLPQSSLYSPDDHVNVIEDSKDDVDASVALRYWRNKTTATSAGGDILKPFNDHENRSKTTCSGDENVSHGHDRGFKSDLDRFVSTEADNNLDELDTQSSNQAALEVEQCIAVLTLNDLREHDLREREELTAPSTARSEISKPPSPPLIIRSMNSYPDMDGMDSIQQRRETEETLDSELFWKEQRENVETIHPPSKPAPVSSLSHRAFIKRSRARASQGWTAIATATATAISNETESIPAPEIKLEVDSASILSGSTTNSATTIRTTMLSSRATRLLREKRKGNVKTENLAKTLAQNIIRGKESKDKMGLGSIPDSAMIDNQGHGVERLYNRSPPFSDSDADISDKHFQNLDRMSSQHPVGVASSQPTSVDDHCSNSCLSPLGDQQLQFHIPQHIDSIQFGPSPSVQNASLGFSTGQPSVIDGPPPSLKVQDVYQIPSVKPQDNPFEVSSFSLFSNMNQNLLLPNNNSLVQPKFSRYNSFDVPSPLPPPIQNILTEDSNSHSGWSETRTLDSAAGTNSTPQESVGQEYDSVQPSSLESTSRLDSFPKGRSFDKGCAVLDAIHSACETLSPKSCTPGEIISNPSIQTNSVIHVRSSFLNTFSDEDVAIEVEYVEQIEKHNAEVDSIESSSIYSLSTRDMDSKDSFSIDNV